MCDLHLEVGQQYLIFDFDVTAPNLILAGDIGRLIDYESYVRCCRKEFPATSVCFSFSETTSSRACPSWPASREHGRLRRSQYWKEN